MTEYWSGSITFTGLGSGTDFDSIIEATMSVESYRLNQLEEWGEKWSAKLEQVEAISSELALYASQLESMDSVGEFLVKTATSTDTSLLSVSAGAEALEGSHAVEIGQKAANDIWTTSAGWDSADTVVSETDATFAIAYEGEVLQVNVAAGTTLSGFIQLVNNDPDLGDGVRASLVDDGEQVHLQLRGLDLGADHAVTIVDQGASTVSGLAPADFEQTQTAQNARIKVDGFPSGADQWIERDTNTIDDVIDGLTFTILAASPGETVEVYVQTDTDAVIANIESFIERTNAIRDAIAALDEDDGTVDGEDASTIGYQVRGNYGMDIIEQSLQDILSSRGVGFTPFDDDANTGDLYASLATVGISTEADENSTNFGHLVIDYEALEAALSEDPDGVARLFSAELDGVSYDATLSYDSALEGITQAGSYEVEYTVSGGKLVSATIGGHAASIDGWSITGASGQPESGLAVTATNHADGTYTGTVSLRQGKINQTLDALDGFTATNGTLEIIKDSYQDIIANNDEAILREEDRLERKRQYLVERYAALESLLGEYEDINDSLASMLEDLE